MLASSRGTTNNSDQPSDKSPLVRGGRTMRNFFELCVPRNATPNNIESAETEGYVEFGNITEHGIDNRRTLGVFAGVFSPVTLSMFSALLFLRMGYIVGNAGLLMTLLQFGIAYPIMIFTVASICAISTNGAVEGGGAYFMISRTLGPDFGGSIGTLFFLANVVSSALCLSGCVEGIIENFGPSGHLVKDLLPDGRWYQFLYCSGINTLNLVVCLIGAAMFAKTTVLILTIVCVCLSITLFGFFYQGPLEVAVPDSNTLIANITELNYTGLSVDTLWSNLYANYTRDYTTPAGDLVSFASVFGVLFSGVTGIMAGANMSGELKQPGRSIPMGTLSAVAFTLVVYIAVSVLTAATCSRELLQGNYLYMAGISVVKGSVAIGLLTATWSAALSNVIGGSRVLDALARDRVFGYLLDFVPRGTYKNNPIAAVFVSWVLVEFVLLIGSLNLIAQLNSVLFLLSYLATNMSCLGLQLASAPNFRPQFRYFSWHSALIGMLGTIMMMFMISAIYAACSILLCVLLIIFLHLFSPSKEAHWGSISQALIFHQVRKYLLLLDSRKDHVKFWRPQVLLLVANPRTCLPLIDFINDLKKSGLYVLGHVLTKESSVSVKDDYDNGNSTVSAINPVLTSNDSSQGDVVQAVTPHWLQLVDHMRVKAFVELTADRSVRIGVRHLVRLSGMGAMKPNTVVFGFPEQDYSSKNIAEKKIDFLSSPDSQYHSTLFHNEMFPIGKENLDPIEYVQMLADILWMNKNLCVCRNFHRLNKERTKLREKTYIDVWPINFTCPDQQDTFDTTALFMMQLACIVNMVRNWRPLTLRICVCSMENGNNSANRSATSSANLTHSTGDSLSAVYAQMSAPLAERLRLLLIKLRISAQLDFVDGWSAILSERNNGTNSNGGGPNAHMEKYYKSVNSLILQRSGNTALSFIYLPRPPTDSAAALHYLTTLSKVSANLPPTIFVHGVSTVTSTTL